MVHQLKTKAEFFEEVASGVKTFEVRLNDRNFQVGDLLALNEIGKHGAHTGRHCMVEVTYVLTDKAYAKAGYAVLGIRPCTIHKFTDNYDACYGHAMRYLRVPVYGDRTEVSE